jgi:SAM-dependent methyltransferase
MAFCREPGSADFPLAVVDYVQASALDTLRAVFPHIDGAIAGSRVIDFGCGRGYQSVGYALAGAESVVGVEINAELARLSAARALEYGLADRVQIVRELTDAIKGDAIISLNSFEHFVEPEAILTQLRESLAPGGKIYINFGPPWYAPRGAHMGFFCKVPWIQLLFSERTILEARSFYRFDGAQTYREAGLAQMSIAKFERVVRECGLRVTSRRYDCVKRLNYLRGVPGVRELAINRVSCILSE